MDHLTLDAYRTRAQVFADDWEAQPPPSDMYALVERFFIAGPTADVGCGSGRDTAWLQAHGYPAAGFDASEAMLAEARRRHPEVAFRHASLPGLEGVDDARFANVLCETVIMHLKAEQIGQAAARLIDILVPGGVLYLSWRVGVGADRRDEFGRLYASFDPERVRQALGAARVLFDEVAGSVSSGKRIHRIVARKPGAD